MKNRPSSSKRKRPGSSSIVSAEMKEILGMAIMAGVTYGVRKFLESMEQKGTKHLQSAQGEVESIIKKAT